MVNDQDYSAFQQRIDKLYEMRRYKDCVKMCKEAILSFPDEWRPYYTLVSSYYNSKQIQLAYDTVKVAIAKFPDNYMFWLSKGQIMYFSKKYEEALLWLHKALGKVPDNVYVYALLAECYQRQEDYSSAMGYASKALAINPNQEIALKALAWSKVNIGSSQASEIIERYLDTYPNSFDAHHVAAVYYLQAKQHDKAVEHFRAALRVQPDKEKAFEQYKDFLLEHVPEYYVSQKPVMKAFITLNLLGLAVFVTALWLGWELVAKCAVGFQIVV
ncbi:MAG TPA: tetratricopeptide repeat protein, partial [Cytophagales bacterium]|nr:tetratricopeptide repeat protein [Cytophagales bacterium]